MPIGAPKDAVTSQLKPITDPNAVTTILGIEEGTNEITWQYSAASTLPPGVFEPAVMKSASGCPPKILLYRPTDKIAFWLRLDGTQSVWALFSGVHTANSVEANLLADFEQV